MTKVDYTTGIGVTQFDVFACSCLHLYKTFVKVVRVLLPIIFLFQNFTLNAQQLFVQSYPIEIYKGASQNWSVAQDEQGTLYFANNDGVLKYDGTAWDIIPLPDKKFVSSVAIDAEGKVYAGSVNEFGYFEKDSTGSYQYYSLITQVPAGHRKNVKDILEIRIYEGGVAFNDFENIYLYTRGKIKIVSVENYGVTAQGTHLYLVKDDGLYVYKNEKFHYLNDLNKEMELLGISIWLIVPYSQNSFLILDGENRLWVLNLVAPPHQKLKPFSQLFNSRFTGYPIIRMTAMTNGNVAIVLKDELHIVSKSGEILYTVSKDYFENEMRDGFVYEDHQHNLWLNANSLILQVITSSPLSIYDKNDGIKGTILSFGKLGYHQYVGTSHGAYHRESSGPFSRLSGTDGQTWNFYNIHQRLLATHERGVYELIEDKANRLVDLNDVHSLCELKGQPDQMLMGTSKTGIWLLSRGSSRWQKKRIHGFDEETRFMLEDEQGNIWISHYNKGIYKLRLNEKMDSVTSLVFYDKKSGLPSTVNNRIYRLNSGEIIVTTTNGIYGYVQRTNRFEPDQRFTQAIGKDFCVYTLTESPEGGIYFWGAVSQSPHKEFAGRLSKEPNGTLTLLRTPFSKIDIPTNNLRVDVDAPILAAGSREIWIGYGKKLISYNPEQKTFYEDSFQVSIKNVWAKDSMIFRGAKEKSNTQLPFIFNSLRFEFSSFFYENTERTEYQYKLDGFNETWSAWGANEEAYYTNLPEGNYTFYVRAKNLYGKTSELDSFKFQILPPWYRKDWAYALYLILFWVIFFLLIQLITKRIRKQKIELQKKVHEKTKELLEMNNEILAQNEEISAISEDVHKKNQEISMQADELRKLNMTKDKLFSIISHDLRGPIRQVRDIFNLVDMNQVSESELKMLLPRLKEGVTETLSLTDNLLYWAKNQMGGIRVKPTNFDVRVVVDEHIRLFQPTANSKSIQLINLVDVSLWVNADSDMIRLVLRNLINNAIKFTNRGGDVTVGYELQQDWIIIFVADTGVGLTKEEIETIMANESHFTKRGTTGEKGMGLGLMLCQEFIFKGGGTLAIESQEQRGSRFMFTLRRKSHSTLIS